MRARARLGDAEREAVIYTNADKAVADRAERNETLSRIGEALTTLSTKGADWSS